MPETKRPLKVFLCHAHSDKNTVRDLYLRLTRDGVDAWLDKAKLLPGQDWELEIRRAVRESDVVVVCLSKQFNQVGFRQKEVRLALDTAMEQPEGEIFIVPARLEECETLESLRKWHWVDLFEEDGYKSLIRALTARAAKVKARLLIKKRLVAKVDHLSALHEIDSVIAASADLRIVLQTVLKNVILQLKVNAASVLLLNPETMVLECVARIGFLSSEIVHASFLLSSGDAKVSLLERRTAQIPNLMIADTDFVNDALVKAEKFIGYTSVPLVAKGKINGVLEIFHRSALDLNDEKISFVEMLASRAALAIDNTLLVDELQKANVELTLAYDSTIEGWLQVFEMRDKETPGHSIRVVELTLRLAAAMGLSDTELQDIRRGALMHDIGKMGVPESILLKPDKLTDEEWGIYRKHPQFAYDMLYPITYLRNSLDIPYCHHEKWDGTGFPRGLEGNTIPFPARIFAVVDVFDALMSDRPYRKAWSKEEALEYIQNQSGKHFDPNVVVAFVKLMRE
jgi:HD-GYP domain-containing protein (c-di-GMP phosphodiesterase class II)